MTALGVSLLLVGTIMVVIEAHVPTLGALGVPGVAALAAGAVLSVSALGGGLFVAVLAAVVLVAVAGGALALSLRHGLAARRRRITAGPEGLIGHLGIVRSWDEPTGKVLVDGALWTARRSPAVDEELAELHTGDQIVVERLSGLTLAVRAAEDWELAT